MAKQLLSGLILPGSTSIEPSQQFSGTSLTASPVVGAKEYDGSTFFAVPDSLAGRGALPVEYTYINPSNRSGIGSGNLMTDIFASPSSAKVLANSIYEVDCVLRWVKESSPGTMAWRLLSSVAMSWTAGTATWGLSGATTPTVGSSLSGTSTSTGFPATTVFSATQSGTTIFRLFIGTGTTDGNIRFQASTTNGTILVAAGSFYKVKRVSPTTGTFAT